MGSAPTPGGPFNVKRVAIIGAGPSGLAAAKFLLAEKAFDKIDVFERQAEVGGVWNYSSYIAGPISVPQTTPDAPPERPIWPDGAAAPIFTNPMYEHLNTNIHKSLMRFSDLEFPSESLLFPPREEVQDYLVKYSQDIRHLISFSKQVEDARLVGDNWEVDIKSTITEEVERAEYDAIVVASGHYSVPYIPSVPGIEAFHKAHPSIIKHAKVYRTPDSFTNKKVIVVGSGASGLDIGTQISQVCQKPLLNSVRTPSPLSFGKENKEEVPPIADYLVDQKGVKFEDGRVETDIDAIVYCTGYFYAYPFLRSLDPTVSTTGRRVIGTYRQLFNFHHPTLAFTALPQKVIPFPISEGQGAAIAKVWANKLSLPGTEEMELDEKKQVDERGEGTGFHILRYPKDAKYLNGLHDWVKTASDGFAKEPAFWDERHIWEREIYVDVRKKFIETGGRARSLEELGFKYEQDEVKHRL